jgi:hypothetical protein
MHRISSTSKSFFVLAALLVCFMPHIADGQTSDRDSDVWRSFSSAQKRYAFFGFIDCRKRAFPPTNAIRYNADDRTYKRVDELVDKSANPMGQLMLDAMKEVTPAHANVHAEHGSVDDGMLWRGLIDQEKQAYVQGVFWCVRISNGNATIPQQSIQRVVQKLNDWYVVTDDDWKDPRSNARVDVPVISALQKMEVLHFKG